VVTAADLGVERKDLVALCRRWQIAELSVFGSAARGEMRPDSDIDLMVKFANDAHWSLWDFVRLKDELEALFGRPIDLLSKQPIKNPFRRASIERDLTVIYAA
jgi:predicted nucleotidyltransferase